MSENVDVYRQKPPMTAAEVKAQVRYGPGMRFGRLEVISFSHINKHRSTCYLCRCDCGNETTVNRNDLRSGRTQSCGCLNREKTSEACRGEKNSHYSHGGRYTKLYRVHRGMVERCSNPKHISYQYYGAKGIEVCEEWKDFPTFRTWALNNGYRDGLSIDRAITSLNYVPENCSWITRSENTARGNKSRRREKELCQQN